tara:strand:+ start:1780 stop:2310 length:531 start_codon:yes stop_codon:yes gene_type:complete
VTDSPLARISAEVAEALLLAFGVAGATPAYDRWKRPFGFDLKDFDEVLYESAAVIVLDWRASLIDELPELLGAFERCGFPLDYEERGEDVLVLKAADGSLSEIRVAGSEEDAGFDQAFVAIQRCLPQGVEVRRSPNNEGSDTFVYAVLPSGAWERAESLAGDVVAHFFEPLPVREG